MKKIFQSDEFNIFGKMTFLKKHIPAFEFNKSLHKDNLFEFTKLEESYNPYDASHPHRHNYFEVLYFNGAGGIHEIDFQSYSIEKNSIHFVSPGQVHLLRRDPKVTGYVLSFTDDFFLDRASSSMFIETLPFFISPSSISIVRLKDPEKVIEIIDIIKRIQKEFASDHSDKIQVIASWMSLFLISCRRMYLNQVPTGEKQAVKNETVKKFRKLVEEKFTENKSVSEYAVLLNITPGHLNDTMQKELGKTASELIHDRIILEAKRLLYHSEKSIKEIAATLNYDDPSYFTKFFKTNTDLTPDQFRKTIREKYH